MLLTAWSRRLFVKVILIGVILAVYLAPSFSRRACAHATICCRFVSHSFSEELQWQKVSFESVCVREGQSFVIESLPANGKQRVFD
jgi:hypothetical protein